MPSKKLLRTAKPKHSIWKDLPEDQFRQTVIALSRATNGVPDNSRHWWLMSKSSQHLQSAVETRLLPSQTEKRLADDFAFILAAQQGVDTVTALCIEEVHEPLGVVLRVSANEGVQTVVRKALKRICDCLMSCAKKELPLMSCISRISALILSLSQERIKSRMQSFLGEPPAHRAERGRVKEIGLGNTLARMKREASTPTAIQLVDRISGLKQNIENTLRRGNSLSTRQVEEIVNESFAITTSDGATPFRTTLKNAGLSSRKWFNNKFIMQVDKLAAYHRIPDTLAREVHRKATRPLFSNIKIEYVDAYQPSLSPVSLTGKKVHCHVHAEIQLVIYYLQSATPLLPRFIGTSKAACFLCHLFIIEHGCFEVSTWHGRLYDQWTIPDLAEYKPESVAKLRIIIQRMIDECLRLLAMMHPRHSYPLTSRHNLQEFPEFSPATTVLSAKHASRSSISQTTDPIIEATVGSPEVADMPKPLPTISIVELDKVDSSADGSETPRQRSFGNLSEDVVATPTKEHSLASGQTSSDEWWESGSSTSTLAASNARPVQLLPDEPHFAAVPGLEIMAEIQPPTVGMMTLKTDSTFGDTPAGHVINLEELDAGQEVTFDRRETEASIVLRFQKHRREVCYVILEWA